MKDIENDIIGKEFGNVIVLSYSHKIKNNNYNGFTHYYNCKCKLCGNEFVAERRYIKSKRIKSCGCLYNHLNEERYNNQGCLMKIVEYNNSKDIVVEFQDDYKYKHRTNYTKFKKGNIKNKFFPSFYGIAFQGDSSSINNDKEEKKSYRMWRAMIDRCYGKQDKNNVAYKGCSVCEDWLCYSNFEKWFDENYYEIENDVMCLDKDILVKKNKIYSPETCLIVPKRINGLFLKANKNRGKLLVGVCYNKNNKNFRSSCQTINGRHEVGSFSTEIEAFNAYKKFKEDYIKQVAEEYKNKIPKKLYETMYNYKVEIDD